MSASVDTRTLKILGQDDWLIYARAESGELVYTVIETDPNWLYAPHRGECWNEKTGTNCDGSSMVTCRIDNSYMLVRVTNHRDEYYWRESEYPLGMSDDEFMTRSRANYLCD